MNHSYNVFPDFINSLSKVSNPGPKGTLCFFKFRFILFIFPLVLLYLDIFSFENSVDPDLMASEEVIRSGSTLFQKQPENSAVT